MRWRWWQMCACVTCLVMSDSAAPQTAAHQAPSMGFSRREHRSGLPFPSPKGTIERKKMKSLSRVQFFATPWTVAHQAPLDIGFSRQEYWSGLPFPSPVYIYTHKYTHTHMCVCVCVYIYIYVYVCIYMYNTHVRWICVR